MNSTKPRLSALLVPEISSGTSHWVERTQSTIQSAISPASLSSGTPGLITTLATPKTEGIPALLLSLSLIATGCATPAHSGGSAFSTAAYWPASEAASADTSTTSCAMLAPASPEAVAQAPLAAGTRLMTVGGTGACFTGNVGAPILMAVPSHQPRLLGYARITLLHPGDSVILDEGASPAQWQPASAAQVAEAMEALNSVDARFGALKPPPPSGARPLGELATVSKGIASALGSFGYEDNRPADGLSVAQVVIQASTVGEASVTTVQSYEREGGRGDVPPKGVREQQVLLTVLPKEQALRWSMSELELSPRAESSEPVKLSLGQGDLSVWSVTLGLMSRMGSETRSAVGLKAPN